MIKTQKMDQKEQFATIYQEFIEKFLAEEEGAKDTQNGLGRGVKGGYLQGVAIIPFAFGNSGSNSLQDG